MQLKLQTYQFMTNRELILQIVLLYSTTMGKWF